MGKKKAPALKSGGLRSLSDLVPATRMEAILNGGDISPVTREEYFVKKAVTNAEDLPAVTAADNGDVLTVVSGEWAKADAPSGLPEVTAADNGDVLTVVSGEWAKAAPAGGGLVVNITGEEVGQTTEYVMDKTLSQIVTALSSGIMPMFREVYPETIVLYTVLNADILEEGGIIYLYNPNLSDGEPRAFRAASVNDYPTYTYTPE